MSSNKRPGAGAGDGDDPWSRLARANRAALTGERAENIEAGDTDQAMRGGTTAEEAATPAHEILQLVTDSLMAAPERADLWMMRFDVQRTLGMKQEFSAAVIDGWKNPKLMRQINWELVRAMWHELAPGEPVPGDIRLPEPTPQTTLQLKATTAKDAARAAAKASRQRRFSDIATQVAGRELAVLAKAYTALQTRPGFLEDCVRRVAPMLKRPTPLQPADALSKLVGGHSRILLKREDQRLVTPEEENATAQAYVAVKLGRPGVITGNDVDAHSLALARVAAGFQLNCTIVVRPDDLQKKPKLIEELRALGAQIEVMSEDGMLGNDPREAALRLWQRTLSSAHLALSLGTGPSPYPSMNHSFQALLGRETELQMRALGGDRPRTMVAAVESEADSIGFMLPQLGRKGVELVYAEPDGALRPSVRMKAYNGAIREHAWLKATGRIEYIAIADGQARAAQQQLRAVENVNISLEDARAVALTLLLAQRDPNPHDFVVLIA